MRGQNSPTSTILRMRARSLVTNAWADRRTHTSAAGTHEPSPRPTKRTAVSWRCWPVFRSSVGT